MAIDPEDYTYITPIQKITKREALKLARELGYDASPEDRRIYLDNKGKYFSDY